MKHPPHGQLCNVHAVRVYCKKTLKDGESYKYGDLDLITCRVDDMIWSSFVSNADERSIQKIYVAHNHDEKASFFLIFRLIAGSNHVCLERLESTYLLLQ